MWILWVDERFCFRISVLTASRALGLVVLQLCNNYLCILQNAPSLLLIAFCTFFCFSIDARFVCVDVLFIFDARFLSPIYMFVFYKSVSLLTNVHFNCWSAFCVGVLVFTSRRWWTHGFGVKSARRHAKSIVNNGNTQCNAEHCTHTHTHTNKHRRTTTVNDLQIAIRTQGCI